MMSRAAKTLETIFLRAWGGGKATLLSVVVALTLATFTPAIAATGGNFILGKINSATTFSRLSANIAGPAMQIFNTNTAANARALDLVVDAGNPPLTVNSTAGKAINLNADKLDGKDSSAFAPAAKYQRTMSISSSSSIVNGGAAVCDSGDNALSGGYELSDPKDNVYSITPNPDRWTVGWRSPDGTPASGALLYVICEDTA